MTADDNTAVVIHGAGDIRVESRPVPRPGPDQVAVRVEVGGICGSDLSYYRHGAVGDFRVRRPMILGHEVVGTVAAVGPGVRPGLVGERVAVDPSSPCGTCDRCREGRPNVCLTPVFLGSASTDPHVDGGFSSVLLARASNLVPVPGGLGQRSAAFAEPLAVCLHAIGRAGGVAGRRVLIVGAGPIGAMAAAAAVRLGAGAVVVSDLDTERLAVVDRLAVDRTLTADLVADHVATDGRFDLVIEASGSGPGIAAAIESARRGGTVVLVGLPHGGPPTLPIGLGVSGELDVLGSFRFRHDEFVAAVDLLGDGLDLGPLLTARFAATEADSAFVTADRPTSMKVQLDFIADP
ncbi:MAG: alcohol dehydrogenase catalytic domain-containing protein [Actinomycetota bacterium]